MEKCNTVCAYSVSPTHLLLKVRWRTCPPHSRPNMCPFKSWRSEILSCYFWSSNTTSWPNSPKHCVSWPLFKYVCIQNPCLSKTSLFRRLWPRQHRFSVRGTEWWWSWFRTVILLYHRCTMWWPKETEELFSEVLKLLFRNIYRTLKILTCGMNVLWKGEVHMCKYLLCCNCQLHLSSCSSSALLRLPKLLKLWCV